MSDGPVRGLIVAHCGLADALAEAVSRISGAEPDALRTISNEGRGPDGLLEAVRQAAGDSPTIIFTDFASGSCGFAARKLSLERPRTAIVTGVNLPLLLDFVFHRDLPLEELVERLVERGRNGISGACAQEGIRVDSAIPR